MMSYWTKIFLDLFGSVTRAHHKSLWAPLLLFFSLGLPLNVPGAPMEELKNPIMFIFAAQAAPSDFDIIKLNTTNLHLQDQKTMASAFSSLGHIHAVMDDLKMAAESHKQSSSIFRNIRDITGWCRELAHVGEAYLALGDLDSALQWQLERLRVSSDEFDSGSQDGAKEEARVRLDLGTIYHKLQKYVEN